MSLRVATAMIAAGSEETTADGAVVEKTLRLNGDVYRGEFSGGSPHGKGKYGVGAKSYANNGDYYEGQWRRRNFQDGHGRFVWANGNPQYVGEWRAGVLSGRGVLIWANGRSLHDVVRENGVPKGTAGGAAYMRALPQQRNPRRAASEIASSAATTPESKRPGQTISKGHKNYELMLQLQLGIRHSAGKSSSAPAAPMRALEQRDFDLGQKFWTRFPPEGSKVTMPHPTAEFRWKDYYPMVFRHLRKLFAVDPADYMLAIGGNDALRELSSPGKSGSFFYLTQDERFMIKTVKKSEVKLLIRMLSSYYKHVSRYRNSLITRFYGVHCVKPLHGRKVRFVVMGNLFCCSEYQIHRRFDLKGSSYGRTAGKFGDEIDETTTLKDLDLNFVFRLQPSWYADLHEQLRRDCDFLESQGIMDYSFLVGVHFCDDISASKQKMGSSAFTASPKLLTESEPLIRLGAHMPARAEQASRRSESGQVHDVILYFGIIDILQDYSLRKWAEHAYKSLQTDPNSISVVNPKLYSKRFQDFIGRTFVEDG